jgi:hypothetical protein
MVWQQPHLNQCQALPSHALRTVIVVSAAGSSAATHFAVSVVGALPMIDLDLFAGLLSAVRPAL